MVYTLSSPRPASGILPTAHPVGEEAWFEAEAPRSHQTMAFCCKQRQGGLPGAPSPSHAFCVSLLPHTPVIPPVLCFSASSPLDGVQPASPYATSPNCLSDRFTLAFPFIICICISPQTYPTKRSVQDWCGKSGENLANAIKN